MDLLDILDSQTVHPSTLLNLITHYLLYNKSIPTKWTDCKFNKGDVGQSPTKTAPITFSIWYMCLDYIHCIDNANVGLVLVKKLSYTIPTPSKGMHVNIDTSTTRFIQGKVDTMGHVLSTCYLLHDPHSWMTITLTLATRIHVYMLRKEGKKQNVEYKMLWGCSWCEKVKSIVKASFCSSSSFGHLH